MSPLNSSTRLTIAEVIDRIIHSGRITRRDETYFFRAMIAETPLTQTEQNQVRKVCDRLNMGLLRVVE
jgi:hypothetical protein